MENKTNKEYYVEQQLAKTLIELLNVTSLDEISIRSLCEKAGVGRALFYNYVEWCRHNGIDNVYIWPDGETPKRIYEEGGYRIVEVRKAGRAVLDE